jgi:Flp pilus assembly pilin Flp
MHLILILYERIKREKGDVAIEYFVIAAVIIVGIINALYALRDQLIILINSITEILAGAV